MDANARMFLDPASDDGTLIRAVSAMAVQSSHAAVLAQVANSARHRPFHRAVAVHELFRWYVRKPVGLGDLVAALGGGYWLRHAVVEKVDLMSGELPLTVPVNGAAFVIRLPVDPTAHLPAMGLYLSTDRPVEAGPLREALLARTTTAGKPSPVMITDFSLFPDRLPLIAE